MILKQVAAVMAVLAAACAANAQTVSAVDASGLKKAIAANKGKVVVVNFWATWCGPCVAEFPDLVKFYKANKAKGVELVTVSCDDAGDAAKVKKFLAKNGLTGGLQNALGPDITGHLPYLDPKAIGSDVAIPRTYVIDRKGKVVKSLLGAQQLIAFQQAVTPYLKAK